METFTNIFNVLISIGSIAFGIVALVLFGTLLSKKEKIITEFVKKNILGLSFWTSFLAMVGSLIYSNLIGFPPCDLCWYQRIFIYPMVFLFGIAWYKKDKGILTYTFPLTIIGGAIAVFHNYISIVGESPFACSAGISCTARYVFQFGFVTIPLMALAVFMLLAALSVVSKKK